MGVWVAQGPAKPSPLDYLIRFLVPDVVALLAMITALREKAVCRRRSLWNTTGDISGLVVYQR